MKVEMNKFKVFYKENGRTVGEFDLINYNNITIQYNFYPNYVHFICVYFEGEKKELFEKWLSKEKSLYEKFIINYFKEIDKINDIPSFKGKLIQEIKYGETLSNESYHFHIQYEQLPNEINFSFFPGDNEFLLSYQIPMPINSSGELALPEYIDKYLIEETIKRMWNPFRRKTTFWLPLLHVLR